MGKTDVSLFMVSGPLQFNVISNVYKVLRIICSGQWCHWYHPTHSVILARFWIKSNRVSILNNIIFSTVEGNLFYPESLLLQLLNVTGRQKCAVRQGSNSGHLAYKAHALPNELSSCLTHILSLYCDLWKSILEFPKVHNM